MSSRWRLGRRLARGQQAPRPHCRAAAQRRLDGRRRADCAPTYAASARGGADGEGGRKLSSAGTAFGAASKQSRTEGVTPVPAPCNAHPRSPRGAPRAEPRVPHGSHERGICGLYISISIYIYIYIYLYRWEGSACSAALPMQPSCRTPAREQCSAETAESPRGAKRVQRMSAAWSRSMSAAATHGIFRGTHAPAAMSNRMGAPRHPMLRHAPACASCIRSLRRPTPAWTSSGRLTQL